MNNVYTASGQGFEASRKHLSSYGKPNKRPQAPTNPSKDPQDGAPSRSAGGSAVAADDRTTASKSKLLPVGKPRHQLVRRPISKPSSASPSPPRAQPDAYSFASDDDEKPSRPAAKKIKTVNRPKPAAKPAKAPKPAPAPTPRPHEVEKPHPHSEQPKPPLLRKSRSPDTEPPELPKPHIVEPRAIAKPARPSAALGHSKKPSFISSPENLETPRPVKRHPPPPPSPPTAIRGQKRRLIDELAAQADDDAESDSSESSDDQSSSAASSRERDVTPVRDAFSPQPQTNPRREAWARQTPQGKTPGVKYTYSSQRTLLSEESALSASGAQDPLDIFALAAAPSTSAFDMEEDDADLSQNGGIRSLHELRQAGASSRVTDEMEDILDRVGSGDAKASSMRRSALIDLVNKLKDKGFRRQFRDFGGDTRLLGDVEKQQDLIAATAMVCIFLTLLGAGKAIHITNKMHAKTLVNLVLPLLDISDDLATFGRQRSSNLSKHAQTNFAGLGGAMKKLNIWESQPDTITPQILALKCLDLTMEQIPDRALDGLVSSPVSGKLFDILSEYLEEAQELSHGSAAESIPPSQELFLALTILKIFSVKAMGSSERQSWTNERLPLVIKALHSSLRSNPNGGAAKTRSLLTQVTLNMTNNNPEAATVMNDEAVLGPIVSKLSEELGIVSNAELSQSFSSDALNNLVLLLGAMVNFCEDSPRVRAVVVKSNALDGLIRPLLYHYQRRLEADSVDKTQVNVAFGYLSVLLSYLCLHDAACARFKGLGSGGGTLEPLFASLREFVALHVAVEKEAGRGSGEFEQKMNTLVMQLEQDERRRNR